MDMHRGFTTGLRDNYFVTVTLVTVPVRLAMTECPEERATIFSMPVPIRVDVLV